MTTVNNQRFSIDNSAQKRKEELQKAEQELLRGGFARQFSVSNTTLVANIDLLENNKDYNFLFNFLPDTDNYNTQNPLNTQDSSYQENVNRLFTSSVSAKEYYLDKATELTTFWNAVPTREIYGNMNDVFHSKMYRLARIVRFLNKNIEFQNNLKEELTSKTLTEVQKQQLNESLVEIAKNQKAIQESYLKDDLEDFRIPYFEGDMPVSEAKAHKEMLLIDKVILKDLNSKFYNAYDMALDNHIDYQLESKLADENQNPELSKLYGYISQHGLNLKNKFLDVFNAKVENGTIDEASLEESLEYFNNNYKAMQDRLFPAMKQAIDNGASFDSLVEAKTDAVTTGFSGLKAEYDSIYEGLIEHANGKKTISDLMREKAVRVTDLKTDGKIDDKEMAQNVANYNRAQKNLQQKL